MLGLCSRRTREQQRWIVKKDYHYRHALAEDDPHASDLETGGIIRAAYKLAARAHKRQSRGKIDPDIRYISHPIMAYDLMVRMGETRPLVLAATLLHDVLEDYPPFAKGRVSMQQVYAGYLRDEGYAVDEAFDIARRVEEICQQVTNPDLRHESKAIMQMQHSIHMSFEAKLIKIADQTASLMCRLMMPDKQASDSKASEWGHKADNLVRFIRALPTANLQEAREIEQWSEMFERVYKQSRELEHARGPRAEEHVRSNFRKQMQKILRPPRGVRVPNDLTDMTAVSLQFPKVTPPADMIARRDMEELARPQHGGIARVDLNERGEVTGFAVWVDPTNVDKAAHNQLARYAVQVMVPRRFNLNEKVRFPEVERRVHIMADHLRPIEVDGQIRREGRLHVFDVAMPAPEFNTRAQHANAISEEDGQRIIAMSVQLSRSSDARRLGTHTHWVDVATSSLGSGRDTTGR